MKKLRKWLSDYFSPEVFNDLDIDGIAQALNDSSVRHLWLNGILSELKAINLEVDRRLLSGGSEYGITDLCARRKAYQDVLSGVLSARRTVVSGSQEQRPNPRPQGVNLDRVTT